MKYVEQNINRITYKFHDFDSIGEFTEYLNKAQINEHFQGEILSSKDGSAYFTGTSSYEEAEELFRTGWNAAAERISKRLPVQTAQAVSTRSKPVYNVVGVQASVPRYLQGIPTNMIDRKQVPAKQKIIVINRDITFPAFVEKDRIEEEGIKALQLIQTLENKGYRVKLNMFFLSQVDDEAIAFRVCVKKPEERLSIAKVAFPLAHPSMLRRIVFKYIETHPAMKNRGFIIGYGKPNGSAIKRLVPKSEYLIPNFINNIDEIVETMGL